MTGPRSSHRERDDNYRGELYRLGRWRVIICADGLQFIVQKRVSGAGGSASARGRGNTTAPPDQRFCGSGQPKLATRGVHLSAFPTGRRCLNCQLGKRSTKSPDCHPVPFVGRGRFMRGFCRVLMHERPL